MAPAMADPVNSHLKKVTPRSFDVVGVGSDTIESVFDQLSVGLQRGPQEPHRPAPLHVQLGRPNPSNRTNLTNKIVTKSGCAKILRPDGSSAGIRR